MKDRPIVIIVMLLGGAVSCICCIVNGAGLLWTLFITLTTLFVFLLIGLAVNKVYAGIKADLEAIRIAEEKKAEELKQAEIEALNERNEWYMFHPDEPFPGDLEGTEEGMTAGGEEGLEESNKDLFTEEGV